MSKEQYRELLEMYRSTQVTSETVQLAIIKACDTCELTVKTERGNNIAIKISKKEASHLVKNLDRVFNRMYIIPLDVFHEGWVASIKID